MTNRWNRKHRRRELSGEKILPHPGAHTRGLPLFQHAELHELADHLADLHELTPEEIIAGALDETGATGAERAGAQPKANLPRSLT